MTNYKYFQQQYGVPARRFAPVTYKGRPGKVTGTSGAYLKIKFHDERRGQRGRVFHPTWGIVWLEKGSEAA